MLDVDIRASTPNLYEQYDFLPLGSGTHTN